MSPPHSLAYEQVLAFYPPVWPKSAENVRSLGRISSDRMLCGARRRLAWLQRAPNSTGKAFLYRFDYFYRNWPPFEPATLRSPHQDIHTGQPHVRTAPCRVRGQAPTSAAPPSPTTTLPASAPCTRTKLPSSWGES